MSGNITTSLAIEQNTLACTFENVPLGVDSSTYDQLILPNKSRWSVTACFNDHDGFHVQLHCLVRENVVSAKLFKISVSGKETFDGQISEQGFQLPDKLSGNFLVSTAEFLKPNKAKVFLNDIVDEKRSFKVTVEIHTSSTHAVNKIRHDMEMFDACRFM